MLARFIDKIYHAPQDLKIIYFYRYISLLVTSMCYIKGNKTTSLILKLLMVICLTISAVILNQLYSLNYDRLKKKYVIIFVVIEVIGNTIILIPTGGINSPYIWYSLNSILITVYFYNIYVSFLVSAVYLMFASAVSVLLLQNSGTSLMQMLIHNNNFFLSFLLIVVAAQLLISQVKILSVKSKDLATSNENLAFANEGLRESMEQIVSLYQAAHSFTNLNSKEKLINIILYYTKKITKSPLTFLIMPDEEGSWAIKSNDDISIDFKNNIIQKVESEWDNIKAVDLPVPLLIESRKLNLINVNSSTKVYGFLGIELVENESNLFYKQETDQLRFIGSLSSMGLERFDLEGLKQQLLINQEQNRIANEIHDNVSQRLFAISCGIFKVIKHSQDVVSTEIKDELINIKDSLNETIKQLRETIYGMSWNKGGNSVLHEAIRKYIDDMSKLYNINISINISGNEELIESSAKKGICRIICEGTSNAARHGKCTSISIDLAIENESTKLRISDDGVGFRINNTLANNDSGIGIKNMHNLAYSLNGEMNIYSNVGRGTVINIILPNNK